MILTGGLGLGGSLVTGGLSGPGVMAMSNEILVDYPVPSLANTIYINLGFNNVQTWNPTLGPPAFQADTAANWAQYALICSDPSGMGRYLATVPTAIPTGIVVTVRGYLATVPGTPAISDARIAGPADVFWDGVNLTTPATAYADQIPLNRMGDGSVPQASYTNTSLVQQAGSPKFATNTAGQMLVALNATTNAGSYAIIAANAGGTLTFPAGWVNGLPTGKLTYKIVPPPILAPAGLDQVILEAGINARQGLALSLAADVGHTSGAGTGTFVLNAAGNPGTTRITATTDSVGDRTTVTLSPPP